MTRPLLFASGPRPTVSDTCSFFIVHDDERDPSTMTDAPPFVRRGAGEGDCAGAERPPIVSAISTTTSPKLIRLCMCEKSLVA